MRKQVIRVERTVSLLGVGLVLMGVGLVTEATPDLGVAFGSRPPVAVASFGWYAADEVALEDGVASSEAFEHFVASRSQRPDTVHLRLVASEQSCLELQDRTQGGGAVRSVVLRFSTGDRYHRLTIHEARLVEVECGASLAEIEVRGARITYDDQVPPPG